MTIPDVFATSIAAMGGIYYCKNASPTMSKLFPDNAVEMKVNNLMEIWFSSNIKVGDYFIRSITDGKEWDLFVQAPLKIFTFSITKMEGKSFKLRQHFTDTTQDLNGSFRDLSNKIEQICHARLGSGIGPQAFHILKHIATEPPIAENELEQEMKETENMEPLKAHLFLRDIEGYQLDPILQHTLTYYGVKYTPIASNQVTIFKRCMIALSSMKTREIILLNPNYSDLLDSHYKTFVEHLEKLLISELQLLKGTYRSPLLMEKIIPIFLKHISDIFPFCKKKPDSLPQILTKIIEHYKIRHPQNHVAIKKSSFRIPVISLDYFIRYGVGDHLHHALAAAYILDRLVTEYGGFLIPNGVVQYMRDNIESGNAHAWIAFTEENGTRWHIDPMFGVGANIIITANIYTLNEAYGYGEKALSNELKKTSLALKVIEKKRQTSLF